jgi:predicted lipoprotein with Yx(FWY)xxD motif
MLMKNTTLFFLVLAVAATLFIAGCSQPQQQVTTMPPTLATTVQATMAPADTIRTATSTLGTILVDSQGRTLYYFANDVPASGTSTCSGKCSTLWPTFSADTVKVSSPLDPADFASITRADGTNQTTYYGWPLYYYAADTAPGTTNGEGILNIWFTVQPDESILVAHTANLGSYLTDTSGKTLYVYTKDGAGTGTCTGTCLAKWPAFSASPLTAPSILKSSDLTEVNRTDGVPQSAYMGMPLYYYTGDVKPGDLNGQGFGGVWYAANVSGIVPAVVTTIPTTVPTTSSASTSSGGY